jgi:hypothetical protein
MTSAGLWEDGSGFLVVEMICVCGSKVERSIKGFRLLIDEKVDLWGIYTTRRSMMGDQ